MAAVEDYLQCSPSLFPLSDFSIFFHVNIGLKMPSFWKRPVKIFREQATDSLSKPPAPETTFPKPASPKASPPEAAPLPPRRLPITLTPRPHYMQQLLTLAREDPNGPLIYDMMANRSSRWRAKNMRASILPPGWKMGISRLGRVPVFDPLYAPLPPPRVPMVLAQEELELPIAVRRERMVREPIVPPRYQATDPQFDYATDEYNLGLPPNLAALYHHNMRRGGDYGGLGGARGGRTPWIPPNLGGQGRVSVVVDDDVLDEEVVDPRVDVLERPTVPRRSTFPLPAHDVHHRPAHIPAHHRGHHRPGHGLGHGHAHTRNDILEQELVNEELEHEVDRDAAAAEIAALQREMDIQEATRREERIRLQEEHARLYQEQAARRATERELEFRERQLAMVEAEHVAEELAHHGHVGRAHGQGYGGHDLHGFVHIPRDAVIDPHHRQREHITHIGHPHGHHSPPHHSPPHHSPPSRRPARHVHFAEDITSSEEERIERHRHRLAQEAHSRRRRLDRDGRPYLYHEDELDYAREGLFDEDYDSTDEYYEPHQRLLMPPRVVHGNWWDEYMDGDDD